MQGGNPPTLVYFSIYKSTTPEDMLRGAVQTMEKVIEEYLSEIQEEE